ESSRGARVSKTRVAAKLCVKMSGLSRLIPQIRLTQPLNPGNFKSGIYHGWFRCASVFSRTPRPGPIICPNRGVPNHEAAQWSPERIHAHRVAGSHGDHRRADRLALAGGAKGA